MEAKLQTLLQKDLMNRKEKALTWQTLNLHSCY